jgi:mRNA interferase HigB
VLSRAAEWVQFPDPKESFPGAAYISGTGTIIFNIGGNKYRLVARVDFEDQSIYIESIFTHEEYDREDF